MIGSEDRPDHVPALASALDEVIIDLDDCEVRVRAEKSKQ